MTASPNGAVAARCPTMAEVHLVDVSIRDGNQSLWGATGLHSAQMLEIAGKLDRVGFRAIDFTSSTHMAVAVRYFRNNPWERIRRMRAWRVRSTPLAPMPSGACRRLSSMNG